MLLYGLDNKRSAYEHDGGRDSEVDSSKRIEQAIYELGNEVKDFIVWSYSLMCQSSQSTISERIDEVAQLILREGSACPDAVIGSIMAW